MQILLSYDIDSKFEEVKDRLIELDFKDTIEGDKGFSNLPNTTLIIEINEKGFTPEDAFDLLVEITDELDVELERAISVEINDWFAIVGEEHKKKKGK